MGSTVVQQEFSDPTAGGCIVIRANPSGLSAARGLIRRICCELALSEEEVTDVTAAAGEALSNAYSHGLAGRGGFIQLSWDMEEQVLTVRIEDDGPGFSLHDLPPRGLNSSGRGNGIPLMRMLSDDVCFSFDEGTTVVLKKHVGVMQSRVST